jgi:PhnB protein
MISYPPPLSTSVGSSLPASNNRLPGQVHRPVPAAWRRQGPSRSMPRCFWATERMRFPGGTVAHAEIQIGDSVVIIEDEVPERGTNAPPPGGLAGSPSSLFIYVEHVDEVVARAVELGSTLVRPPQDQFYGDRDGHIIDPFGHGWTVATHVEDGGAAGDDATDGRAADSRLTGASPTSSSARSAPAGGS